MLSRIRLLDFSKSLDHFLQQHLGVLHLLWCNMHHILRPHGLHSVQTTMQIGQNKLADSGNIIWKKSFYLYYGTQFFTSIMLITGACSIIVRKSVAMYKCNRRFALSRALSSPPILNFCDKIISNYKGTRNGFRYINNEIIDSQMFEILFLSISVLFIKIF